MFRKMMYLSCIALAVALLAGSANADLIVAENLLVDLRATDLTEGAPVTVWPNHGSLGGNFVAGEAGEPIVVETVDGAKAVTLNGGDWFDGPVTPDGIEGAGSRSIEIWVYNPSIPGEETMVAWAHRGGGDGTNMSFNYGNHATWGAAGHWGGAHDMEWEGAYSPAPAANNWWNLVYTYDGATVNIYVNGDVGASQAMTLSSHPDDLIKIGTQNDNDTGAPSGHYFTGSIALVRIHDGVLSQADVINNFQYSPLILASNPSPAHGSSVAPLYDAPPNVYMILDYTPGASSVGFWSKAYFSDVKADVDGRDEAHSLGVDPPWPAYSDTAFVVGYDDLGIPEYARAPLVPGTTYYWCVDSWDGAEYQLGSTWSFTVMAEEAWGPSPSDGEEYVLTDVTFVWNLGDIDPGGRTLVYDVYIGTSEAAVVNATTASDEYMGEVTTESYDATGLASETEHFWRIDQVLKLTRPPFSRTVEPGPGEIWSFTTIRSVGIDDPNLVAWWKLDGDSGPAIAFDSSGYANHGELYGGPTHAPGHVDNALVFDGFDDYIDLPIGDDIAALTNSTFATWVNFSNAGGPWQRIFDFGSGTTAYMFLTPRLGTDGPMRFGITIGGGGDPEQLVTAPDTLPSGWHHVVVTINADIGAIRLYLDASSVADNAAATLTPSDVGNSTQNWLGRSQYGGDGYFNGAIDDFRIYNKVLSVKEIKILAGRLNASDPDPANEATDVPRTPTLGWSPGAFAAAANGSVVHYGTDLAAVNNRTAANETVTIPSLPVPMPLGLGETFYWAVDTVNGAETWPGDIWSFTTGAWISVDDMESYTPWTTTGNDIFVAWRDGEGDCSDGNGNQTGSTLTENASPVLGGVQSMKYDFDNDGMVYSPCSLDQKSRLYLYSKIEAQTATLPSGIGTDWTTEGVKALSLPFHGQAGNATTESLWVQLQDGSKGYGDKVFYGDYEGESLSDFDEETWHDWNIDLDDFNVDLENVVSIVIGIGTEGSAVPGGSGTLFFDEMRLYVPRCIPSRASAAFSKIDYSGPAGVPDCIVDYYELEVITRDWLKSDFLRASNPLIARWLLDGNYNDSSGYGNTGSPVGAGMAFVTDPERGQVLTLPGGDDIYADFNSVGISGTDSRTIACWAKADSTTITDWTLIFGFTGNDDASGGNGSHFNIGSLGGPGGIGAHCWGWEETIFSDDEGLEWRHYAMTYDGTTIQYYGDGKLMDTDVGKSNVQVLTHADRVHIGSRITQVSSFPGSVDDACIFDVVLDEGEIGIVMAGGADTLDYHPLSSPANVIDGEGIYNLKVNFRDYAELLNNWLATEEWPAW